MYCRRAIRIPQADTNHQAISLNSLHRVVAAVVWAILRCLSYSTCCFVVHCPLCCDVHSPVMIDYCTPIADVASRHHFRSARRHYLVVPRHSLSSYGRRAFAVAGPTVWNSLSDDLLDPTLSTDSLVSDVCLKLGCFQSRPTSTYSALEVLHFMH